ncbi:S1C family serine protease [Dictyobacter aurantiacus]|uniref:Protease n=1 Tax=Dictyobacter aurantiacus TaxID=1936993 RepID=A0A401ZL90_9CHLR|nr:trypsin-like peptidase domain-containing protein [Dictyobacter aurantiacus]GCE07588.1 protease [Dictyobacter aurantiacus]
MMNEPFEPLEPLLEARPEADGQSDHPPRQGRSRHWGVGPLIMGALLLAVIFGGGMLAGWQLTLRGAGDSLQTGPEAAQTVNAPNEDSREALREKVVANIKPTVVQLNVKTYSGNRVGSGVVIDRRGYIITNNHVVRNGETIQVVFLNGKTASARLTGVSAADDLAVVHVDPTHLQLSVATLGDSSRLQVGQDVIAIGNPLGISQTVTSGIISALGRNISTGYNGQILPGTIQTDAPINPGSSGGALVDMHGNLIGIPTLAALNPEFKTPASGVGFAIPSNRVQFIGPQLIASGKVTHSGRAALEMQAMDLDPAVAHKNDLPITQGAMVISVVPGGAASNAGIKPNDIIVQIDGSQITNVLSLSDAIINKNPGDSVAVKLYRGRQQRSVDVRLGELSPSQP